MNGISNKRILITRAEQDCARWTALIEERGNQAVHLPCIRSEILRDPETVRALGAALKRATWLVLTSARAALALSELHPASLPEELRIAAVGRRTAAEIERVLRRTAELITEGTGKELAQALSGQLHDDRDHLLAAGSDRAERHLERALSKCGRNVKLTRIAIYRTLPAPSGQKKRDLAKERLDAVLLASPSAAEGLCNLASVPEDLPVFSIGPTTTRAARSFGLRVTREATAPSIEGLLEVMRGNQMTDRNVITPTASRPRRLRRGQVLRDMVAETALRADQLIMPHFVLPADRADEPVPSLPGISRYGRNDLVKRVGADRELGIRTVLLFGLAEEGAKDASGSNAANPQGTVPLAVAALKEEFGSSVTVVTDVCLCAYTDHGHCGILKDGDVHNDSSLVPLSEMALAHARAGADVVAPSDMMDGRVGAIRQTLDDDGLEQTAILAYAIKYASAYYGPFRDAADSAPGTGDRKGYQMDYRNVREALREAELDELEGADMLMVKPALAYLDVIRRVRDASHLPLAAYNVSGEFAQVKAAAEKGWIDEPSIVRENLLAMARAGADVIISYHARDALEGKWL